MDYLLDFIRRRASASRDRCSRHTECAYYINTDRTRIRKELNDGGFELHFGSAEVN